jgi:hypothetical protein
MVGTLQPLDKKFAIVDQNGNPTEYFIRWAQQKQIDSSQGITAAQAAEIADEIANAAIVEYLDNHRLQEGIGIQITPSGNLTDEPTISADIQELLDQISTTRGAIIYRGLLGWASLAPGIAGEVLSTQGAGADPSWVAQAGGGGGNVLIDDQILGADAASITFSSIPATYTDLLVQYEAKRAAGADAAFAVSINGDVGANYQYYEENRFGTGSNGAAFYAHVGTAANSGAGAGIFSPGYIEIPNYADAARYKTLRGAGMFWTALCEQRHHATWRSNAVINSLQFLFGAGGNFVAGTRFQLYGVP